MAIRPRPFPATSGKKSVLEQQIRDAVESQPHLSSLVGGLTRLIKIRLPIALMEEARTKLGDVSDDEALIELALLHLISKGE